MGLVSAMEEFISQTTHYICSTSVSVSARLMGAESSVAER